MQSKQVKSNLHTTAKVQDKLMLLNYSATHGQSLIISQKPILKQTKTK